MSFPRPLCAVIFDLDGVLTDTASAHFRAWKKLADELGIPFDATANESLKGIDRMGSLDLILRRGGLVLGDDAKRALAARKNASYQSEIAAFSPAELFAGAAATLTVLRAAGLKTGLASSSQNAPFLLDRLGIADRFDYVADAQSIRRAKPDPEIFLTVATALGVPPGDCLGVEDAAAGIAAIKSAGMWALGIGEAATLPRADALIADIGQFRLADYLVGAI
ncbi:MAG: beta-phosphoglucomutase [Aliidongia sp.]